MKPARLIDREQEWGHLERFVERGPGLGVVYGARRVGKSFLLDCYADAVGGWRYQAVGGTAAVQLADFGRSLGERLGVGALAVRDWDDALTRLDQLGDALVVLDEYPYLRDAVPELDGVLQRYADRNQRGGLILCGSALSTMQALVEPRSPLYGRASMVLVPGPLTGRDLCALWGIDRADQALWVDAALGGFPGYRPLLRAPRSLDRWMIDEVLSAASPLLDAAEAMLALVPEPVNGQLPRSILSAIAAGQRTFAGIGRFTGTPATSLSRPLRTLERAGLVARVPDPLRNRRDQFSLADPHLAFWLAVIAPNRSLLSAGRAEAVWHSVHDTTWPSQIVGPRWESAVRAFVERTWPVGSEPVRVGVTAVSDPVAKRQHEVDLVVVEGDRVVAVGEAKLRRLDARDAERLRRIRELLGAPDARLILASASGVDASAQADDVEVIGSADVYPISRG